jgi:hypothetical protein
LRTYNNKTTQHKANATTSKCNSKQASNWCNNKLKNTTTSKQQQENNIHIKQTRNKRNCTHVINVSFSNQRLQLLYDLQNNFSGDMEVFNPPLIILPSHEEIRVPNGVRTLT